MTYITENIGIKSSDTQISLASQKHDNLYGDSVDQLAHYKVNTLPPEEEYIHVTKDVEFYFETWDQSEQQGRNRGRGRRNNNKKDDDDNGQRANKKILYYYFRSKGKDGEKKIRAFIDV